MLELTDTHCHIQSIGLKTGERTTRELWAKAPDLTPDSVIRDAAAAGVKNLICVGCDLEDSRLATEFVHDRPNCWAAVGLHPHEAKHYANQPGQLAAFRELVSKTKVIAIGECGLDYYYRHSPKAAQAEVLRWQIELALAHKLPLIFHVREAFDDFWPIFDSYRGLRGVLHSYTDNLANLDKALSRGLYIGANGIVTFVKDAAQKAVYRAIPSDKLLLETDAPFLTPHPYRGSINEPKRVRVTAEFLSALRQEDLADLAKNTTANARKLFTI